MPDAEHPFGVSAMLGFETAKKLGGAALHVVVPLATELGKVADTAHTPRRVTREALDDFDEAQALELAGVDFGERRLDNGHRSAGCPVDDGRSLPSAEQRRRVER